MAATNGAVSFINTGLMTEPAIMIMMPMSVMLNRARTQAGRASSDLERVYKGIYGVKHSQGLFYYDGYI